MALPRALVVADGEVAAYHCIARCVRRALLCGADPVSRQSFEHRRDWVRLRLEELAGIFGIDIGGFAVMANHLHVVLKARPDIVSTWSAREVTERWRRLFVVRAKDEPTCTATLETLLEIESANVALVAERRRRLANVSWFMRCLCEPIARRANREDECTGRFWEGRFKCIALLDEAAILACTAYVDLNPVRAGIAATPEGSRYTSVHDRIKQRQTPRDEASSRDGWLSPIRVKSTSCRSARRASQTPWLGLELDDYLTLLDWTGRQLRADKRGAIPAGLAPILERLRIKPEGWLECVANFGRQFRRAAGAPPRIEAQTARYKQNWLVGVTHCRAAFA